MLPAQTLPHITDLHRAVARDHFQLHVFVPQPAFSEVFQEMLVYNL